MEVVTHLFYIYFNYLIIENCVKSQFICDVCAITWIVIIFWRQLSEAWDH